MSPPVPSTQPLALPREKRTYHVLDGMRGVAALAVVLRHTGYVAGHLPLPESYLAVDLFFVLSGFVLAHAYEKRLAEGLGIIVFMTLRYIRLYPLYLVSLVVALAGLALLAHAGHPQADWSVASLLASTICSTFFIPTPASISHQPDLFPLNGPAWSLLLELIINYLFALFLIKLPTKWLFGLCLVSLAPLIYSLRYWGTLDIGWSWPTFLFGFSRVLFSFSAGMLCYRISRRLRDIAFSGIIPVAALGLVFACPLLRGISHQIYDALAVTVFFPCIVLLGSVIRTGPVLTSVFGLCGVSSYAIYILHGPITSPLVVLVPSIFNSAWRSLLLLIILTTACILIDYIYDMPVRRLLVTRLKRSLPISKRGRS